MPLSPEELDRRQQQKVFRGHVAKSILQKQTAPLRMMTDEARDTYVRKVFQKVTEKSDDELIKFISSKKAEVDPSLSTAIENIEFDETRGQAGLLEEDQEFNLPELEHEAELQSIGVDTNRKLPAGDLERGFGVEAVQSLTSALSKNFGEPVTVFRRGEDILYIDPTDQTVVLAKKGAGSLIGESIPFAGDVVGTIGGGLAAGTVTKSPAGVIAGETAGSAALTAVGEYTRLQIGSMMGIHDLTQGEMLEEAGKKGAIAGATTGITGGALASFKGIRNFLKGRVFTKSDALKHGLSSEEADKVIDEVNKILRGEDEIKATLFARTGDVGVGSAEAQVRKGVDHAKDFSARDIADQKATTKALDIVTEPSPVKGGEAVQEVLKKKAGSRIKQADKIVARNEAELDERLTKLNVTKKENVGQPTREVLLAKQKIANDAVDAQWDEVRRIGGFDEKSKKFGIKIPTEKPTLDLRKQLNIRSKEAITQTEKVGTGGVFAKDSTGVKKPKIIEGKRGNITLRGKPTKKPEQDLENFNKELSGLKKKKRTISKGNQFTDQTAADLNSVIKAMEADRRIALTKAGRTDVLEQIENAEAETAKFFKKFDRSIVGDLTTKNDKGVFKIKEKKFVDNTLNGSKEEAEQLLRVIGDDPSLLLKWKEGISNAFKRDVIDKLSVTKGQKPTITERKRMAELTRNWIEQRKEVLSQFFSKDELSRMASTGDLAVLVKKQIAQQKKILKDSEKFGSGKLASLDPDNLIKFVTGPGGFIRPSGEAVETTLRKIRFVKNATKNHPAAWRRFKDEYSSKIRSSVFDPNTGFIDKVKMSKAANQNSEEIAEIMGERYLKDLKSINSLVQLLSKSAKSLQGSEVEAGIIQSVRAGVAPPLTKKGRVLTAFLKFKDSRSHKAIADALLDQASIGRMAKLAEHKSITRESAELLVSLGFLGTSGQEK